MVFDPIHKGDLAQNVAAGVTGVATGLLGGAVPIVGAAVGLTLELVRPAAMMPYENALDGVVDGSVALIARALFSR